MKSRLASQSKSRKLIFPQMAWLIAIALLCLCGLVASTYLRFKATQAAKSDNRSAMQTESEFIASRSASAKFDETEAKRHACRAANAKSMELYGCEPFDEQPTLSPEQTGWKWIARRAVGTGDFEATVHMRANGAIIGVEVLRLVTPPIER